MEESKSLPKLVQPADDKPASSQNSSDAGRKSSQDQGLASGQLPTRCLGIARLSHKTHP